MQATKYIGQKVSVKIDSPMHSYHPKHGFVYEVNYGYIPNTVSGDGEEIDAYVLGVDRDVESFDGICVAVIHRTNDNDDKLIVVPEGSIFNDEEIKNLTWFQEQWFNSVIIRNPV